MNKPSEVLWGAIRTIQKCGWRQHSYGNATFGYCILGAIFAQNPEPQIHSSVKETIGFIIKNENIAQWNDELGRKSEQILCIMRQAADKLSSQGK